MVPEPVWAPVGASLFGTPPSDPGLTLGGGAEPSSEEEEGGRFIMRETALETPRKLTCRDDACAGRGCATPNVRAGHHIP